MLGELVHYGANKRVSNEYYIMVKKTRREKEMHSRNKKVLFVQLYCAPPQRRRPASINYFMVSAHVKRAFLTEFFFCAARVISPPFVRRHNHQMLENYIRLRRIFLYKKEPHLCAWLISNYDHARLIWVQRCVYLDSCFHTCGSKRVRCWTGMKIIIIRFCNKALDWGFVILFLCVIVEPKLIFTDED
jgi:hypothetical protein